MSTPTAAAFFDVDRTLIAGASALRLAQPFRRGGLLTRRQQARAALTHLLFKRRGADQQALEQFVEISRVLIAGWNAEQLEKIVRDELEGRLHPTVFREALDRIQQHQRQGHRVYAVSATMRQIIEPLADLLGLDGVIASEFEVVDGVFTGELVQACHGDAKATLVTALAEREGIDLALSSSYSDSISDEPLLRLTGRAYAVNPDRELRQLAEREGWGILSFRTPVVAPLHRRRGLQISAAGLAAAAALLLRRSRRRTP